jgi:hypothetical protein
MDYVRVVGRFPQIVMVQIVFLVTAVSDMLSMTIGTCPMRGVI